MDRPFQTDPGDEQPDPETIRQTRTETHLTLAEFAAMIGIYDLPSSPCPPVCAQGEPEREN